MSLELWKKEFYPTPADECQKEDAVDHSLKKWEGFLQANLDRYQVSLETLKQDRLFASETCALCVHYYSYTNGTRCLNCPLYKLLGKPCDRDSLLEDSPYIIFMRHGDPTRMIALLQQAKDEQE